MSLSLSLSLSLCLSLNTTLLLMVLRAAETANMVGSHVNIYIHGANPSTPPNGNRPVRSATTPPPMKQTFYHDRLLAAMRGIHPQNHSVEQVMRQELGIEAPDLNGDAHVDLEDNDRMARQLIVTPLLQRNRLSSGSRT